MAEVESWTRTLASPKALSRRPVAREAGRLIDGSSFGKWAHSMCEEPAWNPPDHIVSAIRQAYQQAAPGQKQRGILQALGRLDRSPIPVEAYGSGKTERSSMAALVRYALEPVVVANDRLAARIAVRSAALLNDSFLRALVTVLLADAGLWELAQTRAHQKSVPRHSAFKNAHLDADRTTATEAFGNDSAPSRVSLKPKSSNDVNAIALVIARESDCRLLNIYLTESRRVDVSADAAYLAAELTYHPSWRLSLQTPVEIKLGNQKVPIRAAVIRPGIDTITIQLQGSSSGATVPAIKMPLSGARTYPSGSPDHAAAVIIDVLFATSHQLRKTHAVGDLRIAQKLLERTGETATAVYRLNCDLVWSNTRSGRFLSVAAPSKSSVKPHDTRGYFQIRGGKKVPVRAYKTGKA